MLAHSYIANHSGAYLKYMMISIIIFLYVSIMLVLGGAALFFVTLYLPPGIGGLATPFEWIFSEHILIMAFVYWIYIVFYTTQKLIVRYNTRNVHD